MLRNSFSMLLTAIITGTILGSSMFCPKAIASSLDDLENQYLAKHPEYSGKTVLFQYSGSWCEPCKNETKDIVKIASAYPDNIVVLASWIDTKGDFQVNQIIDEPPSNYIARYKVITDMSQAYKALLDLGIKTIPFLSLYNENGKLQNRQSGTDGNILSVLEQNAERIKNQKQQEQAEEEAKVEKEKIENLVQNKPTGENTPATELSPEPATPPAVIESDSKDTPAVPDKTEETTKYCGRAPTGRFLNLKLYYKRMHDKAPGVFDNSCISEDNSVDAECLAKQYQEACNKGLLIESFSGPKSGAGTDANSAASQ